MAGTRNNKGGEGRRELRKLSREDLLDLLVEVSSENDRLHGESGSPEPARRGGGAHSAHDASFVGTDGTSVEASDEGTVHRLPTTDELRAERDRFRHVRHHDHVARNVLIVFVAFAAVAVLVTSLWLPVLEVSGTSMEPTLQDGEVVVAVADGNYKTGDVVAFYYNNKILLKRVIATSGDYVNIDDDGNVIVNDIYLDEPYVSDKAKGTCDISLPYQVPDGKVFVMGDHRATSLDSRMSTIGCISSDEVVGRVVFRVWPFGQVGSV